MEKTLPKPAADTALERAAAVIARPVSGFLEEMGRLLFFLREIALAGWSRHQYWDVVRYQLFQVGWRSVPIAVLAGVFVGGIFAIQIHDNLYEFGATAMLGGISASITVREVGPLMIALLLGGRIGAFTTAELGTMNVTDQIDAMRCLATDPIKYLVVPRFYALIIMSWVLTVIGIVIGVLGASFVAWSIAHVNFYLFFSNIAALVDLYSFISGLVKSMVFGVFISTVSCYYGFHTRGGAEDVGRNVNRTVVILGIGLLCIDYVLAVLNDALYYAFFKG
ncbi:MAG: ABC transporter permease [Bdellovibrionota bacterium]